MSTVKVTYSGFVSHDGIPVLLTAGEEYAADHPLVDARPDLFDVPQKAPEKQEPEKQEPEKQEKAQEPKPAETETAPQAEQPKRGPGRPPGSKNKPKTDG